MVFKKLFPCLFCSKEFTDRGNRYRHTKNYCTVNPDSIKYLKMENEKTSDLVKSLGSINYEVSTEKIIEKMFEQMCQSLEECPTKNIGTIKELEGLENKQGLANTDEEDNNSGYVYLIRTRACKNGNEKIYKIGKTKNNWISRKGGYDKGAEIFCILPIKNELKAEAFIKDKFKVKYKQQQEKYGTEYFEGDISEMKYYFQQCVTGFQTIEEVLNNL